MRTSTQASISEKEGYVTIVTHMLGEIQALVYSLHARLDANYKKTTLWLSSRVIPQRSHFFNITRKRHSAYDDSYHN